MSPRRLLPPQAKERRRVPCISLEEVIDYRLEPSGMTFEEFRAAKYLDVQPPKYRKYRKTGFATPSGKVELASSILGDLGFDPLPYHRPAPATSDEFPYRVFSGVREDPFFQTGQRNIGVLRRRVPAPTPLSRSEHRRLRAQQHQEQSRASRFVASEARRSVSRAPRSSTSVRRWFSSLSALKRR